jgi:hypothetical protein
MLAFSVSKDGDRVVCANGWQNPADLGFMCDLLENVTLLAISESSCRIANHFTKVWLGFKV